MKAWEDKSVKKGNWVRDIQGIYGQGQVVRLWSYGCDVQGASGVTWFLGFGWLEKVLSPEMKESLQQEYTFSIDDTGAVSY